MKVQPLTPPDRQADLTCGGLEDPGQEVAPQDATAGPDKQQVIVRRVRLVGGDMAGKLLDQDRGDSHGPPRCVRLRRLDHPDPTAHLLYGLANVQAPSEEADVVHAKANHFGPPQAEDPRSKDQRPVATGHGVGEREQLLDGDRRAVAPLDRLKVNSTNRGAREAAAPECLRARFRGQTGVVMIATVARLRCPSSWDLETASTAAVLRSLARRCQALTIEAGAHEKAILAIVRQWRPELLDECGVGPIVAAVVLCAWSHPGRVRSDTAFAMLAGACPIPTSSGLTTRHHLNRSGDRQLNQALHVIMLSRLRYDPATRACAERRRAEGKTNREIRRCLKRYIARRLYRQLEICPSPT